jgi:probable phosphoglycerate mutase
MTVERVYLIRHGRTAWNVEGRWQGLRPLPLDEVGVAQAKALADYWTQPLTAIWSSDLSRALDTARALGDKLGLTPQIDERLRECNLGIFQGLTKAEMQERHPNEYSQMLADYMGYCIPDGETRRALQVRAYAAFNDIVGAGAGQIALVSHGGTLQMLFQKLLGDENDLLKSVHIGNTSITTVEPDGDRWRLIDLAITPHLADHTVSVNTVSEQIQR